MLFFVDLHLAAPHLRLSERGLKTDGSLLKYVHHLWKRKFRSAPQNEKCVTTKPTNYQLSNLLAINFVTHFCWSCRMNCCTHRGNHLGHKQAAGHPAHPVNITADVDITQGNRCVETERCELRSSHEPLKGLAHQQWAAARNQWWKRRIRGRIRITPFTN